MTDKSSATNKENSLSTNDNDNNNNDKRTIKAIIFDMDGTLLDTESLADKAILQALFGNDVSSLPESLLRSKEWRLDWELKKQILGLRGKEWSPITLNYFQQHHQCQDLPTSEQLIDSWEQNLNAMCSEIEACPGARELVNAVVSLSNKIPMAIATSSRMSGVAKKRTRHQEWFQHIDTIVTGDDVVRGKPAPDIYVEAAKRLEVDPTECLVFEDALSGVQSAKAAGCCVVAVPDPRYTEEEQDSLFGGADVVLNSLWEFDGRPYGIELNMKEKQPK